MDTQPLAYTDAVRNSSLTRTVQKIYVCQQPAALQLIHSQHELVQYINAHCMPFYVQHIRQTNCRFFLGLAVEAYLSNNKLNMKVLYPYHPHHLGLGVLYPTLSAASSKMYEDYSEQKAWEEQLAKQPVNIKNSNGWEHLVAPLPCSYADHGHEPHAFSLHINHMFPLAMRRALQQGRSVELNLHMLPQQLQVAHTLDLEHLAFEAKEEEQQEMKLVELMNGCKLELLQLLHSLQIPTHMHSHFFSQLATFVPDITQPKVAVTIQLTKQRKRPRSKPNVHE